MRPRHNGAASGVFAMSFPGSARRVRALVFVCAVPIVGLIAVVLGRQAMERRAAPPANEGLAILLDLAAKAMAEHRLVAPAGSNACEFYLSVRELDPDNTTAREGLRRLFPAATAEVERSINALQLDEAARELRLLRDVDGTDFTLALLGGKLDAQRQIVIREDEARAARIRAAASP